MTEAIRQNIIKVCTEKIKKKGENVGLSFYAFFDVAKWWIKKHELDHFEKAVKIRKLVQNKL